MIRVTRSDPPANLTRWAQKWTDDLLAALKRYKSGQGKKPSDKLWNKYRKPYVQQALNAMFYGKCAYCESKVGHVAYLHIEHYRPKAHYPCLTFQWENMLLACPRCNGNKGDTFPLENGDETKPLLINPCDDDPAQHLAFACDDSGLGRLVALSERGVQTEQVLDLNRDDLSDERREVLTSVKFIYSSIVRAEQRGDLSAADEGRKYLEELLSPEAQYCAMARQWVQEMQHRFLSDIPCLRLHP